MDDDAMQRLMPSGVGRGSPGPTKPARPSGVRLSMVLLAALGGGPRADAQALELEWTADAACPGEAEVRVGIAAMLIGSSTEGLRASGFVRDRGGSFELDLRWQLGPWREHRILRSHDCEELTRLAAMLLASTVDPFALIPRVPVSERAEAPREAIATRPKIQVPKQLAREPEVEAPEVERVEPPEVSEPVFVLSSEPEPRPRPRPNSRALRGLVLADGLGFINVLPRLGGGGRLGLGIEVENFRVLALASTWFGPGFRSTSDRTVGGDLWAWSGELAACGLPRWRRLEFPLCGQLGAGQIRGRGVGVDAPRSTGQPWVWLGADASLAWWPTPAFALLGGVGLGASLVRPQFGLAGTDAQFTTPVVFGRLHAGIAVRFGGRDSRGVAKTDRREPDSRASP